MIKFTSQTGFSLVETLVAITILLLVIVGPMTIVANATIGSNFSNEQVVASFLAQEGAELAQKIRDDLLLQNFTDGVDHSGWDAFTDGGAYASCFTAAGCGLYIDTSATGLVEVENCSTGDCQLTLDEGATRQRDRYTHDGSGTATIFERVITMTEDTPGTSGGREVEVTSTVTWRTGNQIQEQTAEVRTYLYNVYGR